MRRPLLVLVLLATIATALPKAGFAKTKWPSSGSKSPHASRVQKLARRVVGYARHQLGVPYSWGGTSRATGFDCSGLVYAAYRSIGWTIPLSRYPDTYNKQPICYVALSSQKNYCSLYLMGAFWSASQLEQLKAAFKAAGKKLDMGKCCVHFESPDDLPLEAIGKLISGISSEKWIEMYEQSRLKTKAGQAQKAKQGGLGKPAVGLLGREGALSASRVAAKRVDKKRRR